MGVESEDPFLDERVVSFAYRIPGSWIAPRVDAKWVPRQMLALSSGLEIADSRKKADGVGPVLRDLDAHLDLGPVRSWQLVRRDLVRPENLDQSLREAVHCQRNAEKLVEVALVERFLRRFQGPTFQEEVE